jgi:SAM-dependent methyltransferase
MGAVDVGFGACRRYGEDAFVQSPNVMRRAFRNGVEHSTMARFGLEFSTRLASAERVVTMAPMSECRQPLARCWEDFVPNGTALGSAVWRAYCDGLHSDLIAEWCGGRRFRRALKTDVFDEAVGEGCLGALAAVAGEVHGIDVSGPIVEKVSSARKGFHVRLGDVRKLDFPDASFDLVFSNSTLDHFETETEIVKSVSEFARILEGGGFLLITMDNPVNPVVGVRNWLPQRATGAIGLVPYFMGRTLPMRGLVDVLGRAGFRVEHRRHTMHAPRLVALHLCRLLENSPAAGRAALRAMLAMEVLGKLPTAPLTGYYSAALAVRE